MKRLLALDQSSKITGYSVFDSQGKLETYGKFTCDNPNIDKRLVLIRDKVEQLIKDYDIQQVMFEDIQQQNNVANNVQTFKILAEVYGVISEYLEENSIPHSTVLAATWKSYLGIKGKTRPEQKRNAQLYVEQNYDIHATQDEIDSICIGLYQVGQSKNDWSN